ncbi:MAG TPA: hypothetical protein VFH80_23305 [Solirubrobacteraceae bacterium]|nr:hypothetical protein [Solirubrobacteraceae bacterium]
MAIGPYRLDELGWLQFERLCDMVLAEEAGVGEVTWLGRADRGRVAMVETDLVLEQAGLRLRGPLAVAVVWVRPTLSQAERLTYLVTGAWSVPSELGFWFERVLVVTNLDAREAQTALTERFGSDREFAVLGARELGDSLDRHPALRAAMPSILGLRDLEPLIAAEVGRRSAIDVSAAQELARVFWPTRAYERAREALRRHRFVVLTGPPEMGKTAIARMIALAQLTDGWEAHECTSPDQVRRAFDRERPQVFVADDAFGSTEYRADAAEWWARELGRMLQVLDDRHWLIWTSRPAPLKAGLRRVQRERGSERFPAPGEVLVDASELDLAEKTLILFRHAKAHDADEVARNVVRSAGVSIVEHSHFTPERIRRLVDDRLDELVLAGGPSLLAVVEDELARPTDAMRTSFRALEDEHRELLIALLDAPAGLIDERELAATVRRHRTGGLRRPPGELIDRLTDHFLRVTPLGIGWVHPSWRDLVIDELAEDAEARRRFLSACGIYGVMLALSRKGGVSGGRSLPLMICDGDWDALGDRMAQLVPELEDQDLGRLLLALGDALSDWLDPAQRPEMEGLTSYVLGASSRSWHKRVRPVPVFLLDAWYAANALLPSPAEPPPIRVTWSELEPSRAQLVGGLTARDLQGLDDWLTLAQILAAYDPDALERLGFYGPGPQLLLAHLAVELGEITDPDVAGLAASLLRRIRELSPRHHGLARTTLMKLQSQPADERWWVPQDIDAPPSREPVSRGRIGFTRDDVSRVLADL